MGMLIRRHENYLETHTQQPDPDAKPESVDKSEETETSEEVNETE